MPTGDIYYSNKLAFDTADSGSITLNTPTYTIDPNYLVDLCPSVWTEPIPPEIKYIYNTCGPTINKGGDENMRYLYEVILVNPKNDEFFRMDTVAKSETSALMIAYDNSKKYFCNIPFDDLKTFCRVLMEWKKEKSLKKAIEIIKEAVE